MLVIKYVGDNLYGVFDWSPTTLKLTGIDSSFDLDHLRYTYDEAIDTTVGGFKILIKTCNGCQIYNSDLSYYIDASSDFNELYHWHKPQEVYFV